MKRALFAGACAVGLGLALACSSSTGTQCDCADPGARVHVPPESAGAVVAVRLSGPACAGLTPTCTQAAAVGCAEYSFTPTVPGACDVDVVFADSTFTATLTFARTTGCCAGIYPSPVSAGDVTATHGPVDAGGGG